MSKPSTIYDTLVNCSTENPSPTGKLLTDTSGSTVTANPGLASSLFSGQKTSTGTAVSIATSQALTQGVIIQALSTNVKSVYIGPSGVTTSTGFELQPGQASSAAINNLNLVYLISSNSGDGICYLGS